MSAALDLVAHLEALGIPAHITRVGNVCVSEPDKLLAHLTDEKFIARTVSSAGNARAIGPVPSHRTDNPVGALHEWCARQSKALAIADMSDCEPYRNGPHFAFTVECDGLKETWEEPTKNAAKRAACQAMLHALALRYGAERKAS